MYAGRIDRTQIALTLLLAVVLVLAAAQLV